MKALVITHSKNLKDEFREVVHNLALDNEVKQYLASVNGPAQSYTLTGRKELTRICHRIEANLIMKGVKKKNLVGTQVTYCSSGRGRGNTPVTQIRIKKTGAGWRLMHACKKYVSDYQTFTRMDLTIAAEQDIFAEAFDEVNVQTPSLKIGAIYANE